MIDFNKLARDIEGETWTTESALRKFQLTGVLKPSEFRLGLKEAGIVQCGRCATWTWASECVNEICDWCVNEDASSVLG